METDGQSSIDITKTDVIPSDCCPVVSASLLALAKDDVFIVDSLLSGTGRTEESGIYVRLLKPVFDFLGISHRYCPTSSLTYIAELAASLKNYGKQITVVFISGDTSVNEFINGLESGGGCIRILVFPAGTGNSLALSIGIVDEARALRKLFTYKEQDVRLLNLYQAKFPSDSFILQQDGSRKPVTTLLFVVVVSWAFHASLVADSDSEERRKRGIQRFQISAQENLARPQQYYGSFKIGKREFNGPFAYFVVTPSKKFEPTFLVLPQGNIFDQSLFVVGFKSENDDNGNYIMEIMGEVYDGGKHVKNPKVLYERVESDQKVDLHVNNALQLQKRRFCVDGAIVVLPEKKSQHDIQIGYAGTSVKGWDIHIIS